MAEQTGWRRWALPVAAVIGVGPWGALAGLFLFLQIAIWMGAPRTFDSWGLWLGLVGMTLGFALSSWGAVWLVRRSPRVCGAVAIIAALLVIASSLADPLNSVESLYLFGPGAVLAVAVLLIARRRKSRKDLAPDVENPGAASTPG